jgi:hypothetical protein
MKTLFAIAALVVVARDGQAGLSRNISLRH